MTGDLRTLSRLRDEARRLERETVDARARRDRLAVHLRRRGFSAQSVGAAAGLAPSYVDYIEERSRPRVSREEIEERDRRLTDGG